MGLFFCFPNIPIHSTNLKNNNNNNSFLNHRSPNLFGFSSLIQIKDYLSPSENVNKRQHGFVPFSLTVETEAGRIDRVRKFKYLDKTTQENVLKNGVVNVNIIKI